MNSLNISMDRNLGNFLRQYRISKLVLLIIFFTLPCPLKTSFAQNEDKAIGGYEANSLNPINQVSPYSFTNNGFADIVDKLLPAVVNISTTQKPKENSAGQILSNLPEDSVFDNLKQVLRKKSLQQRKLSSLGSGFIISKDGYIVTKYHVIENAQEIKVSLDNRAEFDAKIIGKDKKTDLALLKIDAGYDLEYVKLVEDPQARIGQWVIVIGNPFGLGGSVSTGIISARGRDIVSDQGEFIQTDAAINRGNSGGPLFNIKGELVGVATSIFSTSGGSMGIGFATPTQAIIPIIDQLKDKGSITRGWIGVSIQDVSKKMALAIGMKEAKGALVIDVIEGGPADIAGVLPSDIITRFDGKDIGVMKELPKIVSKTSINKKVKVGVIRQGKAKTLTMKVKKMTDDSHKNKGDNRKDLKPSEFIIGLGVSEINKKIKKEYKIDQEGVLVLQVKPNSKAGNSIVEVGDIILSANQVKIRNISDLKKVILKAIYDKKVAVLLLIKRDKEQISIVISL